MAGRRSAWIRKGRWPNSWYAAGREFTPWALMWSHAWGGEGEEEAVSGRGTEATDLHLPTELRCQCSTSRTRDSKKSVLISAPLWTAVERIRSNFAVLVGGISFIRANNWKKPWRLVENLQDTVICLICNPVCVQIGEINEETYAYLFFIWILIVLTFYINMMTTTVWMCTIYCQSFRFWLQLKDWDEYFLVRIWGLLTHNPSFS